MFTILDSLKPTATGLDLIPVWFLRQTTPCSNICSTTFTAIQPFYQSFNRPHAMEANDYYADPKDGQPVIGCRLYRPISTTPVISRIMEKIVLRNASSTSFPIETQRRQFDRTGFCDQFAF